MDGQAVNTCVDLGFGLGMGIMGVELGITVEAAGWWGANMVGVLVVVR
jgi:hypothetical protein